MKLFDFLDQDPMDTSSNDLANIAKMHNVSIDEVVSRLHHGVKIENEFRDDPTVCRSVVLSKLSEDFDSYHSLGEVSIDNKSGLGSIPDGANIDYMGLRVMMKPSVFLRLAAFLPRQHANSVDHIKSHMKQGGGVASPFLDIRIPQEWEDGDFSKLAKIRSHEGRNRMYAILEEDGDTPIEVHIFISGYRSRHIKPEWIKNLNSKLIPQKHDVPLDGPFFTVVGKLEPEKQIDEDDLEEVYPGQSSGRLKNYIKRKYGGEISCRKAARVINDPDASNFYKKRASWYKSLHCKGSKQVREDEDI